MLFRNVAGLRWGKRIPPQWIYPAGAAHQVPPVKHDIQRDPNSCLQSHPLYLPVMDTRDEEELFGLPSSLSVVLINTLGLGEWSGGSQTPPSAYSDIRADYTPVNTLPAPKPSRDKSHHLSCAFEPVTLPLQIHGFLLICSDVTFSYCPVINYSI